MGEEFRDLRRRLCLDGIWVQPLGCGTMRSVSQLSQGLRESWGGSG